MSDETTEPGRARVTPAPEGPVVPDSPFLPQALARPRPRVVVRADLRPALLAAVVIAVLGAPVGWVWSRLAPPQESLLGEQGQLVPLTLASYHQFDALAIYLLLGFATGILTAAALWAVRSRRGPVMLLAGVAGSLLAAWLGSWLGPQFAQLAYSKLMQAEDPERCQEYRNRATRFAQDFVHYWDEEGQKKATST